MSDFSTSSVDQFLRDHGFALSGLALSSLSDDDGDATPNIAGASGADVGDTAAQGGDERSFQSASEEEPPVTPRFTLLADEDLERLAADHDTTQVDSQQNGSENNTDAEDEDALDRSLVLGAGSGFSSSGASNAAATDERSRIAQTLHEEGAVAAASALHQRLRSRRNDGDSAASSAPAASPSGSFSSGSHRVLDDELSDALGVTTSTPERRSRPSGTTAVPPAPRSAQRSLFPTQEHTERNESDHMATRRSLQQPRVPSAARPPQSRLRSASAPVVERLAGAADSGTTTAADEGTWSELNDKLRKHGLQAISFERIDARTLHTDALGQVTLPDRESMTNLVQDVILQLERKDQIIQDIILESNRNSREQSRMEGSLLTAEKKNEEVQRSLEGARNEIVRLQEKLKKSKEETEEQAKKLKQACLNLQQQLKVSEHRVKAKEVLVERMQQKLQQQVDKESRSKSRDRQVFRQLQQRDVKKTNVRDSQSLEFIGMYETQREQMQDEIEHLTHQVAALNAELRDKENFIARKASSAAKREIATWGDEGGEMASESPLANARRRTSQPASVISDDMMLERLEAARREQEQAATKLRRREAAMIKKVAEIEQELLSAHETIAELKEENANLALEAESRPSIRDYRLCQRRIHQLERQVSESKLALEEATDLHELRKYMGTRELIERDRLNHRLHLNRLNALPRETTLEVVKDVCRVLNLTDITLITPSLEKLCHVVAAVPRMEKFIRDVCGFVFLSAHDGAHEDDERSSGFELERVLPTLQQWAAERRKLHALEEFKAAIVSELCKRSIGPSVLAGESDTGGASSQPSSVSRAVHIVAELVDLEKNVLHHREIYSQAAAEIERRPSVLVNQIVRHFSHLFHVKNVEGVLPKINEIYLFVNEMENFLNVVRGLLRLKSQASVTVCLNAIRDALEGDNQSPVREHQRENRSPNKVHSSEPNFVVEKKSPRTGTSAGEITGVQQVREMAILVRELKRELGAATMHEILPRTKRLMELLSLSIHNSSLDDEEED